MKGIILVLTAALLYGVAPSIQNIVMDMGAGPAAITACCYLISMTLSLLTAKVQKHAIRVTLKQFCRLQRKKLYC
ncbi:hypothetical protein NE547_08765 [Flavonifractor sp. DFI.6.63]|uniref:hypothetical protein n=1 Tax=Flavonifractor sp. DFI.6.63 TaxID=2963704 RepID=UPI00210BBDD3|nr:hypothetical protein [Flavonifractor sp. DFI.6.63]MCQ5029627.1 hypothetical protein [Flavonifractor sp. DFI.6.63]